MQPTVILVDDKGQTHLFTRWFDDMAEWEVLNQEEKGIAIEAGFNEQYYKSVVRTYNTIFDHAHANRLPMVQKTWVVASLNGLGNEQSINHPWNFLPDEIIESVSKNTEDN